MSTQRKIFLPILLSVLGLCLAGRAQDEAGKDKHLLWKVSSKRNSIYVLGSIHLLKKENYPLPEAMDKAFDESEVAAFEVDIAEMEKPESAQQMLLMALMPAGKLLRDEIDGKTYARLRKRAGEMGMDIAALNRFKPWYIALAISMAKLQQLGFMPGYGVDRRYHGMAVKAKKKVVGLETSAHVLGALDELTKDEPDEFLNQVLDDLDIIEEQLAEIVKAWFTGNTKGMEDTVLKSFKDHPDVYEALITKRNKRWLVKIEEFLKGDKRHFVVVGAAHVVGEGGLIDLLRKKGYDIRQL